MKPGGYIGIGLILLFWLLLLWRFLRGRIGPVRTVKAVVADKNKIESFSKYSGTGKTVRYSVVFETENGRRVSFWVSEFSWKGYRLKERGTLTYRGDRLLDFK